MKRNAERYNFDYDALQKYDIHLHSLRGGTQRWSVGRDHDHDRSHLATLQHADRATACDDRRDYAWWGSSAVVGGIREVVAARARAWKTAVLPAANKADVEEIPTMVREKLEFVFAENYEDVFKVAFPKGLTSTLKAPKVNRPKTESSLSKKTTAKWSGTGRRGNPKRRFGSKDST